jgi:cell division septum initiation protein DivIVA
MPDQSSAATEHAILAEITRPLEALPEDPLAYVDADFPTALRGYDRVAVDEYVRETRRLVAELQATRSPEAAVRRALERVGEQISGILQRAHETAEQITAQSRSEAEDRLEQARLEAAQITNAAEQHVRDLDADTDRIWLERQRIVADAEDLAAQLLALAKAAAERFPAEAETAGERFAAVESAPEVEEADLRSEVEKTLRFRPLDVTEELDDEALAGGAVVGEAVGGEAPESEAVEGEGPAGEGAAGEGPAGEGPAGEGPAGEAVEGEGPERRAPTGQVPADAPSDDQAPGGQSPAQPGTDDDDTAVIPPASQAANRRANQ